MFRAIDITGSGMSAAKELMEITSNNVANMNTTRTSEGGPYQRQSLILQQKKGFDDLFQKEIGTGVEVSSIERDNSVNNVYDPEHPDANEEGYVLYPAINLAAEITDMIAAQRHYGANVSVFNAEKEVLKKTQEIGRV